MECKKSLLIYEGWCQVLRNTHDWTHQVRKEKRENHSAVNLGPLVKHCECICRDISKKSFPYSRKCETNCSHFSFDWLFCVCCHKKSPQACSSKCLLRARRKHVCIFFAMEEYSQMYSSCGNVRDAVSHWAASLIRCAPPPREEMRCYENRM